MKKVTLQIDEKKIDAEEGQTVFQAAKKAGIIIPNLCYHDNLEPFGACRLCMVEIEKHNRKRLVASCCYPVEEGLVVVTRNEKIDKIRRVLSELLLAISPSGTHAVLAKEYGVTESRFELEQNPDSPCNLCGLCVRYCKEIKKSNAVAFNGRGVNKKVALVPGVSDQCLSCRQCFTVCDAGKIVYLVDNLL